MITLFDESRSTRYVTEYAANNEKCHLFVEGATSPKYQNIRATLESWFSGYPDCQKENFKKACKGGSANEFTSKLFELMIFTVLRNLGLAVVVEPEFDWSSSKPDFLVSNGDDLKFIVEVTTNAPHSDDSESLRKEQTRLWNFLNKNFDEPNYRWSLKINEQCSRSPNFRSILEGLRKYALQADQTLAGSKSEPFQFRANGWDIEIGRLGGPIDSREGRPFAPPWSKLDLKDLSEITIVEKIRSKCKQHAKVDLPLVVAVSIPPNFGQEYIEAAIFGPEHRRGRSDLSIAKSARGLYEEPLGDQGRVPLAVLGVTGFGLANLTSPTIVSYECPGLACSSAIRRLDFTSSTL